MKNLRWLLVPFIIIVFAATGVVIAPKTVKADGDVAIDENSFPDEHFRYYIFKNIDSNHDEILDEDEASCVGEMDIISQSIKNLDGIQYFPRTSSRTSRRKTTSTKQSSGHPRRRSSQAIRTAPSNLRASA